MFFDFTWLSVYEGDGTGANTVPGGQGDGEKPGAKTFTQEEVNKFVAEERRKTQKQNQEMVTQLETLKQNEALTKQERDDLQARIEALQNQYMTKEEQAKSAFEKQQKELKAQAEANDANAKKWQGKYSELFVTNEIRKAADDNKAFSADQMVDFLLPRSQLADKVDDAGKPTGEFVAIVPFTDEKEGKTLKLSVGDAMKKMREMPDRYGNFFKGDGVNGLGLTTSGSGNANVSEFRDDMSPAEYQKFRVARGLAKESK